MLKSKPGRRWQWTTGASAFYQWLDTDAPVTFHEDGLAWLNALANDNANKYLPTISQGPMTMQFVFSDLIGGSTLPIGGVFKTPVLNTALFHQSTFNDLFGAEGLSFTVGLRMGMQLHPHLFTKRRAETHGHDHPNGQGNNLRAELVLSWQPDT